jgi:hypothetical protein
MTEQQESELRQIRAEQNALRQQWARLEARITAVEAAAGTAAAPMRPAAPVRVAEKPPLAAAPMAPAMADTPRESLEMRIGTTWLVRAGIVLLLTSLAFLGNYLYQNVVPHLGPGGKVALLYAAAGLLTMFGFWLERSRQARELIGLQDYARVVLAGGLAAIYYVTYAAHYYPNLRVVESPLAAGLLLLGWAAFLVWLADRRESEILATFAILLAYYTSAINEIATFTLFSNLVLTVGAIYLIRRHLWRIFPFASLLATFGSYGFWHYFYAHPFWRMFDLAVPAVRSGPGFWLEGAFLFVYWALFTWAVFTTGENVLPAPRRATFISLNNGAFFLLTTWILLGQYSDAFWKWSLVFGCVLGALAEIGRRASTPLDRSSENAYYVQGILLVTLGFIDYFSGWQLSLILAVQSRLLVAAAIRRRSAAFLALAVATALIAFVVAAHQFDAGMPAAASAATWITALAAGAFFIEEAWRCEGLRPGAKADGSMPGLRWSTMLTLGSPCFALLGAWIWFLLLENEITFEPARACLLAAAAVALLLLGRALRLTAVLFFAAGYLLMAQLHWLASYGAGGIPAAANSTWWNLAALLAATIVFVEIWKWIAGSRGDSPQGQLARGVQIVLMALGTLCGWCYVGHNITLLHGSPFNVAARWSLYAAAVFFAGLALRERVYRWLGLLILVATLGRVGLFDIWQIDLLERALSLLTLGAVLLGIGFFYTRYGSRVRDIL